MGGLIHTVNEPDQEDVLNEWRNDIFATLNCVQIGKIEKVNSNQTVSVSLQVQRRIPNNETRNYPVLVDCPYVVMQGAGAYLDMPITVGDYCIVLFNDRNMDVWWSTENVTAPADKRKHSLSDGMALVGINSNLSPKQRDGTFVRLLGTSGPGAEEFSVKGQTLQTALNTFTTSIISAVGTVGTPAQNAAALTAIGAAATALQSSLSTILSTEVKIG